MSENLYFPQRIEILRCMNLQLQRPLCLSKTFSSTKFSLINARTTRILEIGLNQKSSLIITFCIFSTGASLTEERNWGESLRQVPANDRQPKSADFPVAEAWASTVLDNCANITNTWTAPHVWFKMYRERLARIYSECLRIRVILYFYIRLAHSVRGKIVVSTHCSSFIWKQTFVYPLRLLFIRLGSVGSFLLFCLQIYLYWKF